MKFVVTFHRKLHFSNNVVLQTLLLTTIGQTYCHEFL